jgi:ADP-heptose:LPS heptosyltransferase
VRILVVRNDRLGDFILALPLFAWLKQQQPTWQLAALVPPYTAPLAAISPWIDEVVIDEGGSATALAARLRQGRFDAIVTLYSTRRTAWAAMRAAIPLRLAPATKWFQFFYTTRLRQRRSQSIWPEYRYNLQLAGHLLHQLGTVSASDAWQHWLPPPLLSLPSADRRAFCAALGLAEQKRLIFVHPGSGGSATNLTAAGYRDLINALAHDDYAWVIIAGPQEAERAETIRAGCTTTACCYPSHDLVKFATDLQLADLFMGGSSGPLHLAAALNRPLIGLYPRNRSASPLRWQPLNHANRRLILTAPESDPRNVAALTTAEIAEPIAQFMRQWLKVIPPEN